MEFLNSNPIEGSTDKVKALLNAFRSDLKDSNKKFAERSRPELARFKLKFYWLDKYRNNDPIYSEDYEWINGKAVPNEKAGYMKLREMIVQEHKKDSFLSAMVWININPIAKTEDARSYNLPVIKKVRGQSGIFYPGLRWNDNGSAIILLKPTE